MEVFLVLNRTRTDQCLSSLCTVHVLLNLVIRLCCCHKIDLVKLAMWSKTLLCVINDNICRFSTLCYWCNKIRLPASHYNRVREKRALRGTNSTLLAHIVLQF